MRSASLLLRNAGLPKEARCIGSKFTIAWIDQDKRRHRFVGIIGGLHFIDEKASYHRLYIMCDLPISSKSYICYSKEQGWLVCWQERDGQFWQRKGLFALVG